MGVHGGWGNCSVPIMLTVPSFRQAIVTKAERAKRRSASFDRSMELSMRYSEPM
jgi:hypothetical protein